jgi:sugar lactone lactonase YvrE
MKRYLFFVILTFVSSNMSMISCTQTPVRPFSTAMLVTTVAGPNFEVANAVANVASFDGPRGTAVDAKGNVYVADQNNNLIRKISAAGLVTTLAGSGTQGSSNGIGTAASFARPEGVAIDGAGNVYVADFGNNMIRMINPSGVVTTVAGNGTLGSANGAGTVATFNGPTALTVDISGDIYVADFGNNLIRMISPSGMVRTLAGSGTAGSANGVAGAASFNAPTGVAVDDLQNVYVADQGNNLIRMITASAVVTTLAGTGQLGNANGVAASASFSSPFGVAVDDLGNVFVSDQGNQQIREISALGTVSSLAGSGAVGSKNGTATEASFWFPSGLAIDALGNLYVADYSNNMIRIVNSSSQIVSTLAGTGQTGSANTGTSTGRSSFGFPVGIAVDASGNLYVADRDNSVIWMINPSGTVTNLAGSGQMGFANGPSSVASFTYPVGVAVDATGNVYVADQGNNVIRLISAAGMVSTFAGSGSAGFSNGSGTSASFNGPYAIAVDNQGNVYVTDVQNFAIRKISPSGAVSTLAGSGSRGFSNGTGASASFNAPYSIAVDNQGNVYVGDLGNFAIRKISPSGAVSTLAGSGAIGSANGAGQYATFNSPSGVAVDNKGNVYVGDAGNNLIRLITPTGLVSTYAGSGASGFQNGYAYSATFYGPSAIAADASGNIYVVDKGNDLIRKINY